MILMWYKTAYFTLNFTFNYPSICFRFFKNTFIGYKYYCLSVLFNNYILALAGVAQWIEHRPVNQGVTGSIPGSGASLGFGMGPQ